MSAPLAPLARPFEWAFATGAHLLLGVLLGVALTGVLRLLDARWSWAAVLLLPAWTLSALFGVSSLTALTACSWAALRGLVLHRRDLRAGADIARRAQERPGPAEVLGPPLGRWLHSRVGSRLGGRRGGPGGGPAGGPGGGPRAPGMEALPGRLEVGHDRCGRPVSIPFGGPGGGRHTLLLGATGSGKTVTEAWIAARAVELGMGAVVVDPKGDPHLRSCLACAAEAVGRRLIEWTPSGPTVYNPLGAGDASSIADRALTGETFTEPHYLRQAHLYLLHAVATLQAAGEAVCLRALVEHFDVERLRTLACALPGGLGEKQIAYLDSLSPRQRSELGGARDRLAILDASSVGRWLDPATPEAQAFDLAQAVREHAVVYFSLQADQWPLLAQMLGGAIVADLVRTAAQLSDGERLPTVVVLDEFSTLAAAHVGHAFARGRSAGFNMVLATQELSDLRLPHRRELAEQVQGNLSALIAHRQVVPGSIDWLVELTGERGAWRTSYDAEGRWRSTRVGEPLLDGERLRKLPAGRAAVIELGDGHAATFATMHRGTPTMHRGIAPAFATTHRRTAPASRPAAP